jgi:PhnB protein
MTVKPIPDGYHSVTPYLICKGAADAIEFYKRAFCAVETMRLPGPGGAVMHAEFQVGDSRIMMADEFPEMNALAPQSPGSSGVGICLYVDDADAIFAQATAAGAKIQRPIQDQFYGDRSGTVEDPFGHVWTIATHIEDLTEEEIQQRMQDMMPE